MKLRVLVAAALSLVLSAAAHAQTAGFYVYKDTAANIFNMKIWQTGTNPIITTPSSVSSDGFGLPLSGAAGTTNPTSRALYVQGVTGGIPFHMVCDSGCAGGGGGGGLSVPFAGGIGANGTPTGFKDNSGNFQPLLGDVTAGQWVSVKASVPIAVTGTFWQTTQPISAASLPLPTGAATQTTLASVLTALGSPFQAGGSIGNTAFGISGTLPAFAATPTFNIGTAPTITVTGSVSLTGTLPAFAATPTFNLGTLNGAATASLQTSGNASLTSIDGKTPALGQALAAGSVPIVLTAAQLTTLTPPAAITGFATAANQTSVVGSAGGGTAAASALLAGGQYNSSPITLTTTQQAALQVDTNGFLKVNVSAGGASGGTSSSFSATFPATGTAAGMSQGGNMVALTGTSGNLNVQCSNCSGSGASAVDEAAVTFGTSVFAPIGGAYQTTATSNPLVSGQQGLAQLTINRALHVNLRTAAGVNLGDATTPLQVSLANTAGNATALLVTGTGGTFPVSQATASSLNATVVGTGTFAVQASIATASAWGINTLGSTTSGQSGQLALGAVTTVAPTYTTAQSNALSLTTAGSLRVDGSGSVQPVSGTVALSTTTIAVTNVGTFATQSAQSGNWTSRTVGNTGAILDFAGQNASSPANSFLIGGQFNTSPTTITSGNASPLQLDATGNLRINCITGCGGGSGGTSSSFGVTFPATGTAIGLTNGTNMIAWSAASNYGTSPGAIAVPAVNASITNTVAVTLASGSIASGAIASGAVASGAFASGAVSSGAYASGSLASGAVVDITNVSTPITPNTATAIKGVLLSMQYNSTQATFTNGQQGSVQGSSRGALYVATGADTFNVTVNAALPAGTALIGKFGIDQTTPGTTNGVSIAQVGSSSLALGSTTASASIPVVIASNQTAADPCMYQAKTNVPISTASGTFALVTGVSAKKIYVCSLNLGVPSGVSVSLAEGSSATCGTSAQAAVMGVATNGTAASGLPIAANGGLTLGNGGGTVAATATNANYLCLFQSGTAQIAGNLTYVQQ